MSINPLVYGIDQAVTMGFLRSRGGELRSGRLAVKFEDYADQGSIGGPLATFEDYFVENPNDPRTFTRNGLQVAESRESLLMEMRSFPHWASDPMIKIQTLLGSLSSNMSGRSLSMCFLPMKQVVITQESRTLLGYDDAALLYFQERPSYSPVYLQNAMEAVGYVLSQFYGETKFKVNLTLDQRGLKREKGAVEQEYVADPRQWKKYQALLDQKYGLAMAQLIPKGADAILEPLAPAILAYTQWEDFCKSLPKTIVLDHSPEKNITIRYLMELIMAFRPITKLESVLPLYGDGPTYVDAETLDKDFDALEVVYNNLPSHTFRHIPLSYRYLLRGGAQKQYTIAGTPEYTRVEYLEGKEVDIGGRSIPIFNAHYSFHGDDPKKALKFAYTNPILSPAAAATAFRTTVSPSEIVLAYSQPIKLSEGEDADVKTAQDYIETMKLLNEHLHDQFYLPRNWTEKAGLKSTVLGVVGDLLKDKVPGIKNLVPINGAKIADAGEVKASLPLKDYSIKVVSAEHVKTVGQPVFRWTRQMQGRLAGYWAPWPAEQEEVGTGWYTR